MASGLQRVGRAGHQVGATSRGVFFPNHRGDLIESAVVVERMRVGAIEEVATLRNPLDVLAQQIVAVVAAAAIGGPDGTPTEIKADDVYALVRRADGFRELPHSAYEATLDMLSGRYPSEDFAELRPRIVWQRDTGVLTGRPGAQRLAVTSGGTIPDRGLFGVFLVGEGSASGRHNPGRRVGELDEEMVYETRVGDVFTLGTTSWRVEQITHDQVLVSPAPGVPGRLPFWKGDSPPRPLELGRAFGAFVREIGTLDARVATSGCARPDSTSSRPATCRATSPSSTRRPPPCPPTPPWWSSGSATSSVTGGCVCTPRSVPGCSRRGRWPSSGRPATGTGWRCRPPPPTTASCCESPTPSPNRPERTW